MPSQRIATSCTDGLPRPLTMAALAGRAAPTPLRQASPALAGIVPSPPPIPWQNASADLNAAASAALAAGACEARLQASDGTIGQLPLDPSLPVTPAAAGLG